MPVVVVPAALPVVVVVIDIERMKSSLLLLLFLFLLLLLLLSLSPFLYSSEFKTNRSVVLVRCLQLFCCNCMLSLPVVVVVVFSACMLLLLLVVCFYCENISTSTIPL